MDFKITNNFQVFWNGKIIAYWGSSTAGSITEFHYCPVFYIGNKSILNYEQKYSSPETAREVAKELLISYLKETNFEFMLWSHSRSL